MKKQKKTLISIVLFFTIVLLSCNVFATDISNYISGEMKFSEAYENYLKLSEEEKEKVISPLMYEIPKNRIEITNPLKLTKMLGTSLETKYSLQSIIPKNIVIKDQAQTNSCWTFSSIAALESVLALNDYRAGRTEIVYDLSERHMEYATTKTFLDAINPIGFNREIDEGGNLLLFVPYLTNGTGAIAESEMPFQQTAEPTKLEEIQDKNVITQVNDIMMFASYSSTEDTTVIKQQMKEHIKNHGAIDAGIYGAGLFDDTCYNNETGAIYCNNPSKYMINHAVAIVGWDDNYSKTNFVEGNQPKNNGAWIIKNSWGTEMKCTIEEMKEALFYVDEYREYFGWTTINDVPDELAIGVMEDSGYTIENGVGTLNVGDNGFMYISYEDVNIYRDLTGITNAQNEITYENIYQYDTYGAALSIGYTLPKLYLATVFDRKTTGVEYLTQVSINAPEPYICKVYVNPNGTSKAMKDLQPIELKTGEYEAFDAGYHTIEFANPLKITGDSFVVVLEITGIRTDGLAVMMEFNYGEFVGDDGSMGQIYNNVTVESGKCFIATEEGVTVGEWTDASETETLSEGGWPDFDTTIKAFTTSKVLESIEVTTPPTKTSYIVGQDFDKAGMIVKSKWANGNVEEITDYVITNGTNLTLGQTSVTIEYQGKTTTQTINVEENSVTSITIKTPPTQTEYFAGEIFNKTGMEVEATFADGTTQLVTDYTITDGENLKNGQTSVTIEYQGKTITQLITVNPNPVVKVEITQEPIKVNYVAGQDFETAGMKVMATYENGLEKEVTEYTIANGTNLQVGQTEVTIEFEGQIVTQKITVVEKAITEISIKSLPTKTEYIQNKEELDLAGGFILISYNDNTTEEISMTSNQITVSGFDNTNLGIQTITLTYQNKTVEFNVEVKELPKPENSKFDDIQGNVTRIRAYYFSDESTKEYTIINVEISDIIKSEVNDKMEYYYYLSSNQQETGITDWIKVNSLQNTGDSLSFEINTAEISNYEEVANAENVYLYIKEVAIRNDMKSELITSSILLEVGETNIEQYVDGEKVEDVAPDDIIDPKPGESGDNTLAPETLPNAGKSFIIIIFTILICIIGRITYFKYKDIEVK